MLPSVSVDPGLDATATAAASLEADRRHTVAVFAACGLIPVAASVALGPGRFAPVAGLCFGAACAAGAHLTQSRHRLHLRRSRTLLAMAIGAVGQPLVALCVMLAVLFLGAVPPRRDFAPAEAPGFLVITAIGSALCAVLAAMAAALWANKIHRRTFVEMLVVAVLWPAVLFIGGALSGTALGNFLFPRSTFMLAHFGPGMTLAWHVPMAMLTGFWLSRHGARVHHQRQGAGEPPAPGGL
jgi:hypothetical protein